MSFGRKTNLNEPLFGASRNELEDLSQKITEGIDGLTEYIQALEETQGLAVKKILEQCESKCIGIFCREPKRVRKEEISEANDVLKRTLDLFRQFDSLNLKKKEDIEYRNKVMKRTKDSFKKQNDRFTKLLKDVQRKEKIHLQAKQNHSAASAKSRDSAYTPIGYGNDFVASELTADLNDLDFTETMLREREGDLIEIRRLAHELNLTAQYQAKKVHEASQDIELVEESTKQTEISITKANKELNEAMKYQSSTTKRNLCLCCLIAFAAIIVVLITASNILL